MKKENRVKTKQDFQRVISSKQKINCDSFVIYYLIREDINHARFGVSVSKKIGNAVQRVKIRRQVRSMIREITKETMIQPKEYVIIIRQGYLNNEYRTNLNKLLKLLKKIGGTTSENKK